MKEHESHKTVLKNKHHSNKFFATVISETTMLLANQEKLSRLDGPQPQRMI
jgi:hypothetical protein